MYSLLVFVYVHVRIRETPSLCLYLCLCFYAVLILHETYVVFIRVPDHLEADKQKSEAKLKSG